MRFVGILTLLVTALVPYSRATPSASALDTTNAAAETPPASQSVVAFPLNEFGVWIGGSLYATRFVAKMPNVSLGLVSVRYARLLAANPSFAVELTVDIIPVATLSYPDAPVPPTIADNDGFERTDSPVYGMGAVPFGLQLDYRAFEGVHPFVGTSAGFLYFPAPVPDSRGKQFNFTADVTFGIRIVSDSHVGLTIGYRAHHLSNGNRGRINPGFDSGVFYIGISMFR